MKQFPFSSLQETIRQFETELKQENDVKTTIQNIRANIQNIEGEVEIAVAERENNRLKVMQKIRVHFENNKNVFVL